MSRSPLAYPLTRGVDGDAGGAADLQTDVMRFMAILSLCLVAIFALVQSLPTPPAAAATAIEPEPAPPAAPLTPPEKPVESVVRRVPEPVEVPVAAATDTDAPRPVAPQPAPVAEDAVTAAVPPAAEGFTLRFASDLALTRLVARGDVGFYALGEGRAQRLTVRESRLEFWDASVPGAVHEMEIGTVPQAVIDAYRRAAEAAGGVRWGVTLPNRLKRRLDTLMRENDGGALVIAADGSLELEAS